jgi:hypothetical protein
MNGKDMPVNKSFIFRCCVVVLLLGAGIAARPSASAGTQASQERTAEEALHVAKLAEARETRQGSPTAEARIVSVRHGEETVYHLIQEGAVLATWKDSSPKGCTDGVELAVWIGLSEQLDPARAPQLSRSIARYIDWLRQPEGQRLSRPPIIFSDGDNYYGEPCSEACDGGIPCECGNQPFQTLP